MIKQVAGGVISLVIGGTVFSVSQSDVMANFSNNTGMSQQEAEQYVSNIKQSDLDSFSEIGKNLISDGNSIKSSDVDCVTYTYNWETPSLTCEDGKTQLLRVAQDEINLGNCYLALDSDLGSSAKNKIDECISDIDVLNADLKAPIISDALDEPTITSERNSNAYNKSVLQAALSK